MLLDLSATARKYGEYAEALHILDELSLRWPTAIAVQWRVHWQRSQIHAAQGHPLLAAHELLMLLTTAPRAWLRRQRQT